MTGSKVFEALDLKVLSNTQSAQDMLFAELRGILNRPHSKEAWKAICTKLEYWEDEEELLEIAIPYIAAHTTHWPNWLKSIPDSWSIRIERDGPFPLLALIESLHWPGLSGWEKARELHLAEQLSNVRALYVREVDFEKTVTPKHFKKLEQAPFYGNIDSIYVTGLGIDHQSVEALCQLLVKNPIDTLELKYPIYRHTASRLSLTAIETLIASGALERISRLTLRDCGITNQGIQRLCQATGWDQLESLDLSSNQLTAKGIDHLITSAMPQLTYLNLGLNDLGQEGVEALVTSGHFPTLKELHLYQTSIENPVDFPSARLPQLEVLDIGSNIVGLQGLAALLEAPLIQQLRELSLTGCHFSSDEPWIDMLIACPPSPHKRKLALGYNEATHEQCKALSAALHIHPRMSAEEWYQHIHRRIR